MRRWHPTLLVTLFGMSIMSADAQTRRNDDSRRRADEQSRQDNEQAPHDQARRDDEQSRPNDDAGRDEDRDREINRNRDDAQNRDNDRNRDTDRQRTTADRRPDERANEQPIIRRDDDADAHGRSTVREIRERRRDGRDRVACVVTCVVDDELVRVVIESGTGDIISEQRTDQFGGADLTTSAREEGRIAEERQPRSSQG